MPNSCQTHTFQGFFAVTDNEFTQCAYKATLCFFYVSRRQILTKGMRAGGKKTKAKEKTRTISTENCIDFTCIPVCVIHTRHCVYHVHVYSTTLSTMYMYM